MDKLEFSDLYKFLVSAGIILIALAILLPWFYLKEPFDLLIENNKILLLTKEAQSIIKERQSLIGTLYTTIPFASVILLLFGIISSFIGLFKWNKKQTDIDKRDLLTTKKLENEVQNMTAADVLSKNTKEFEEAANISSDIDELTTTTTIPPTKENFISNYVQIEQFLSNKLTSIFQGRYKILPNIQIKEGSIKAEYDLVLSSEQSIVTDLIFEFKFYPNGVTRSTVRDNVIKLDWKVKLYSNKVKNNVMPILLTVLPAERFNPDRLATLSNFSKELNLMNKNLKIVFIKAQDLDNLNDKYFFELISQ
ncbi:hypothetical protein [Mucilaginibacter endophyticus]|uniref:hypothetical protein n=1 Tax=Mucilaginibacter endophyticus TaxID=2675003 RepID=UPI000E0DD728|nr:hypothetical protein [Mucilaginibacter endophyticus]